MSFKDLHKLKKVIVIEKEFIKVQHLVVGKDIFALSIYKTLQDKYGKEQVRLLSEDIILKSDLLPKGPSSVRGSSNQKIIQELYPQAIGEIGTQQALFYKDMAWKNFGGRSKPEALKFNEEFFTSSRFNVDAEALFPELKNSEEYLRGLNSEAYQVRLKSIQRSGPNNTFKVECLNGTEFECEKLYFGQSPYQYLEYYLNKNELSDVFTQFCESTKTPSAICVKFVFEKPISDVLETLFIPLSYTHEWGHFVGEFNQAQNGEQEIELIHFLDEDQASEEDVSRYIRLLKKSMEKIFDKFSATKAREYIVLEQEIGCLKIDDNLFERAWDAGKNESKNLYLFGINAPIVKAQCKEHRFEYSTEQVNILARAILVQDILLKNI